METFMRALGVALVVVIGGMGACTKGLEPPSPTPEVFILDGLIAQYGEEVPCYAKTTHEALCKSEASEVELLPQMPLVQVQLEPFAIDQFEVSNKQYRHCVAVGGCEEPLFTDSWSQGADYYYNTDFDDYPVHQVTSAMAEYYCAFQGRRLPTDVEWQRVAQGSPVFASDDAPLRTYPAQGLKTLQGCKTGQEVKDFAGQACSGKTDLIPVDQLTDDFVEEGYDKDLNPARVYNLFSNVSEFTSGFYQADVTCKEPLPELDVKGPGGGAFDDFQDCISCLECRLYQGDDLIACDQECKICEACAGTSALGVPYRPDGYPNGPLNCHIDCWGETRESPRCVRWSPDEMPLAPEEVEGTGSTVSVRGGHVAILDSGQDSCRFRADYRSKRVFPDGSASNQNNATEKGLGFRCARSLIGDERSALLGHVSAANFAHLDPNQGSEEVAEFEQPSFIEEPPAPSDEDEEGEDGE